ncbi:uncharacterized protein BYT42DRAFT_492357 [Radiomyces spectabilis]|uniref:uncharacterized protein n=1 Tax=Radiomyces spectabilis TaxID=64574 RepID=UPI00221EEFD3|nr:uncharacterized protein BYT42DRAFT_492357 [Radiomyces spectabilis]KAI8388531.1 hypothetical protein BYT42DRAFT_492357 [Radiomyces spectabilis]
MTAEKTTVGSVKSGKEPATSLRRQKRFLEAGLYAPIHKQNAKEKPLSKREKKSHDISIFNFPLPLHHGDVILNSYHDFSLPADIMQEFNQGLIGKFGTHCTKIDKPHYTRIRSNIFVERKPNRKENKIVCQCIPPADGGLGCGEDCLNRMLFYECEPNTCPCGDQCSNRRFQKKEGCKNLDVFLTRERGWGLRTLVDIKRGDLIIEYRGEIISHKLCEERMRNAYKNQKNFYFLDYRQGEVVDACEKGTDARFINHSCDPNCHIEKWALKGELHVGVFASKDIPANTELFYDYNFSVFKDVETQQECRCGSENCRGILGKKPPSRRDTRNHISNLSK